MLARFSSSPMGKSFHLVFCEVDVHNGVEAQSVAVTARLRMNNKPFPSQVQNIPQKRAKAMWNQSSIVRYDLHAIPDLRSTSVDIHEPLRDAVNCHLRSPAPLA